MNKNTLMFVMIVGSIGLGHLELLKAPGGDFGNFMLGPKSGGGPRGDGGGEGPRGGRDDGEGLEGTKPGDGEHGTGSSGQGGHTAPRKPTGGDGNLIKVEGQQGDGLGKPVDISQAGEFDLTPKDLKAIRKDDDERPFTYDIKGKQKTISKKSQIAKEIKAIDGEIARLNKEINELAESYNKDTDKYNDSMPEDSAAKEKKNAFKKRETSRRNLEAKETRTKKSIEELQEHIGRLKFIRTSLEGKGKGEKTPEELVNKLLQERVELKEEIATLTFNMGYKSSSKKAIFEVIEKLQTRVNKINSLLPKSMQQ